MDEIASFGEWLRRRRKALDLTQAALADRAGCVPGTIKSIEADARRPSKQLAERLADVLELRPEERAAFLKAARAELSPDHLASPTQLVTRAVGSTATAPSVDTDQRALPTGTVTFLFTDIEGSTQLWEQHPDAMPAALARHDTILADAITAHGGVVVKRTGDGMLAAQQASVHQRSHTIDQVKWQIAIQIADRLDRLNGAAANEYAQARKQHLFSSLKQMVTPVDRRTNGLLARRKIAPATCQDAQPPPQPLEQRLGGKELDARRR